MPLISGKPLAFYYVKGIKATKNPLKLLFFWTLICSDKRYFWKEKEWMNLCNVYHAILSFRNEISERSAFWLQKICQIRNAKFFSFYSLNQPSLVTQFSPRNIVINYSQKKSIFILVSNQFNSTTEVQFHFYSKILWDLFKAVIK